MNVVLYFHSLFRQTIIKVTMSIVLLVNSRICTHFNNIFTCIQTNSIKTFNNLSLIWQIILENIDCETL